MKMYIFRDIYTGKLYKVHDNSACKAAKKERICLERYAHRIILCAIK